MEEDRGALSINDGKGTVTNAIAGDDVESCLLWLWGLGGVCKAAHLHNLPTTEASTTSRVVLGVSDAFESDPVAPTVSGVAADANDVR